jgi:hypothetical protein
VYPVYLSLGNIDEEVRNKLSNDAYMPIALLPIHPFEHIEDSETRIALTARLLHKCLNLCLKSLKAAAAKGVLMRDPEGNWRLCFTPLLAYLCDIEEATMLAGVMKGVSHVTLAWGAKLGDPTKHHARTGDRFRNLTSRLEKSYDPWRQLKQYINACRREGYIGVEQPFWADWSYSDPSVFFAPDGLHSWHVEFKRYSWNFACTLAGTREMDKRYASFQPLRGRRYFVNKGITTLKKTTCRTHRDMQRFFMASLSGMPPAFQLAMKGLMIFRYLAQMDVHTTQSLAHIQSALREFHENKWIIHNLKLRTTRGWAIPKLDLMLNVIWSIAAIGAAQQYSTETPESLHKKIKIPGSLLTGNRHNDAKRIVIWLDLQSKLDLFQDSIEWKELKLRHLPGSDLDEDSDTDQEDSGTSDNEEKNSSPKEISDPICWLAL